jgi:hypothetical protein
MGVHSTSERDCLCGSHTSCDSPKHPNWALQKDAEFVPVYPSTLSPCPPETQYELVVLGMTECIFIQQFCTLCEWNDKIVISMEKAFILCQN